MINLTKVGKGGLTKKVDLRDYRLEVIPGAVVLPIKFSLRDKIGKIKHQGTSLSCGSQAIAYYTEVLNKLETVLDVELSARDTYSLVYQPDGGQYSSDCANKVCNSGVVPESMASSYEAGNPPTEAYMRLRNDITVEEQEVGMTYWAKKYVTWDNCNLDLFKQAIVKGNGCMIVSWGNNPCWQTGDIAVPSFASQMAWKHIVYVIGYDDDKKAFEFVNSWGQEWGYNGFGWLPYDYATKGYLSNPITLVDVPNGTYSIMMRLIGLYKNIISLLKK